MYNGSEELAERQPRATAPDQALTDTYDAKATTAVRAYRSSAFSESVEERHAQELVDRQVLRNEIIAHDQRNYRGRPGKDASALRCQLDREYLALDAKERRQARAGGYMGDMVSAVPYRAPSSTTRQEV